MIFLKAKLNWFDVQKLSIPSLKTVLHNCYTNINHQSEGHVSRIDLYFNIMFHNIEHFKRGEEKEKLWQKNMQIVMRFNHHTQHGLELLFIWSTMVFISFFLKTKLKNTISTIQTMNPNTSYIYIYTYIYPVIYTHNLS